MVIFLPISLILNIILIFRGISLVKTNEELLDKLSESNNREFETLTILENMLSEMKEIDLRGSFESDDEVGIVFTELKNTIESYKNQI
jgi:hypothetical protein